MKIMKQEWWNHVKHFESREFACPCCGVSTMSAELIGALDMMREELEFPIIITSGYRCKRQNHRVGGAPASFHRTGEAVDIRWRTDGWGTHELMKWIYRHFHGIGIYHSHIHIDMRHKDSQATWRG